MGKTETKATNLRKAMPQLDLVNTAAGPQVEPRTNFLPDQPLFSVTAKQFRAFDALMSAPMSQNAGLKRLLDRRAPWDR